MILRMNFRIRKCCVVRMRPKYRSCNAVPCSDPMRRRLFARLRPSRPSTLSLQAFHHLFLHRRESIWFIRVFFSRFRGRRQPFQLFSDGLHYRSPLRLIISCPVASRELFEDLRFSTFSCASQLHTVLPHRHRR